MSSRTTITLYSVAGASALLFTALLGVGCNKCESPAPTTGSEQADLSKSKDLFESPVQTTKPAKDPLAVVATVNGKNITQGDVDKEVAKLTEMASRRMPPEKLMQMQDRFAMQALDNLVLKTILVEQIDKQNIQVNNDDITNAIARFTASLPPGMTLDEIIKANQWTQEEFDKNLVLDLRINKLLESQTAAIAKPTDAELKSFYDENKERFEMPESVTARHILIATEASDTDAVKAQKKAKAEDLQKKLVAGADFAKLAQENSDCPSKSRGGDLGSFPRGQMVKPFEEAAFGQKINEIGPVVETQFGYHIIQVTKKEEAHTMSLDEVKDRLSEALYSQNRQKAARDYLDSLKSKADVKYTGSIPPLPAMPPMGAMGMGGAPSRAPARMPKVDVAPPAPIPAPAAAPAEEAKPAPVPPTESK